MTIKSTLIDLGIVVLIAGSALSIGFVKGDAHGVQSEAQKVLAAEHNEQTAKDNAAKDESALTQIRQQLADQKQQLVDAQKVAAAALDARDHVQTQLAQANTARKAAERKLADETPDCSTLQHLPICPELARRLFEQPAQAPASGTAGAHDSR